MSWEWTHSPEAYENARKRMSKLPIRKLHVIYAEIEAADKDKNGFYITSTSGLDLDLYETKLEEAKGLARDVLAERIWRFMEEFRTCDNGGFNAYCCPYLCHSVPFAGK